MINTDWLKKIYLFEGFTDAELKQIAAIAGEKNVIAGDSVFSQGGEATALFVLKEGSVQIVMHGDDEQNIAAFSSGSHFGEMAFLDRSVRAAAAVAKENSKLLEIPYADLERVIQQNKDMGFKFYRALAHALARRIRQTTLDLSNLKDLKLRHI